MLPNSKRKSNMAVGINPPNPLKICYFNALFQTGLDFTYTYKSKYCIIKPNEPILMDGAVFLI